MRSRSSLWLSFTFIVIAFAAGYGLRGPSTSSQTIEPRKPLYYHDPMHPGYKSDKPGIAPDCGMQLEPVYADDPAGPGAAPLRAGAVKVSLEQQQIAGLRTASVSRTSGRHTLRVLGRVAADETRVYRITAFADGVIRQVSPAVPGSLVNKEDLLATYFVRSAEIFQAIQGYFTTLNLRDGVGTPAPDNAAAQKRVAEELVNAFGLTETQLRELSRGRQATRDIEFRSPIDGILLARNAGIGQRAEKGLEIFRIAGLSHVWVLADVFENDSDAVRRVSAARISYRGREYRGAQRKEFPQFDATTRTLKVRLDVDNPDLSLRPDMFVDVEFDVQEPEGISVPTDAVLDSGVRKTVFVKNSDGSFEPREVRTGSRYGDRVEIASGLKEGEEFVFSGMFLLDSESRLRGAAVSPAGTPPPAAGGTDPVCGMKINPDQAANSSQYGGKTHYFCAKLCKEKFDANPSQYAGVGKS